MELKELALNEEIIVSSPIFRVSTRDSLELLQATITMELSGFINDNKSSKDPSVLRSLAPGFTK